MHKLDTLPANALSLAKAMKLRIILTGEGGFQHVDRQGKNGRVLLQVTAPYSREMIDITADGRAQVFSFMHSPVSAALDLEQEISMQTITQNADFVSARGRVRRTTTNDAESDLIFHKQVLLSGLVGDLLLSEEAGDQEMVEKLWNRGRPFEIWDVSPARTRKESDEKAFKIVYASSLSQNENVRLAALRILEVSMVPSVAPTRQFSEETLMKNCKDWAQMTVERNYVPEMEMAPEQSMGM